MLILNTNNMALTHQPARLASEGAPVAVAAMQPSNVEAKPGVAIELSSIAAKQSAEQKPSAAQLQNVVDSINKALKQSSKNLEFTVDESTKKSVVKLVDTETGDVIRQFPSEEALAISRSIGRFQQGMLLKQEA